MAAGHTGLGGFLTSSERPVAVAARITEGHGRLDLLVNNAWTGYERLNAGEWEEWNAPLRQQPLELFDAMFAGGVRTHYVALAVCAPLLIATPGSLVVNISVAVPETEQHAFGAAYAMAKVADDRLALAGRAPQVEALAARYGIDVSS